MIDSNDLPLSVSRETVQNHPSIKTIRKKIIGKGLDLLVEMSEDEKDTEKYENFFRAFRQALKYGMFETHGANSILD
jgi:heat shock protein 90kDa beta